MPQPEIVIVVYRPKPGREKALLKLAREHVPLLREEGLATHRTPIACRASDGSIIEIFEWVPGGSVLAHTNPRVVAFWARYTRVCDFVPLQSLPESNQLLAGFTPVELHLHPNPDSLS